MSRGERTGGEPPLGERLGVRLFMLCALSFPKSFRDAHGTEMRSAFAAQLRSRLRRGVGPTAAYTLRSALDVVRQGMRERARRGRIPSGHGRRGGDPSGDGVGGGLGADLRLAVRNLRRAPGFAFAAVIVLAIGIGANAAVFSALRVAVLAPPPFPEPDRLVVVDLTRQVGPSEPATPMFWSFPKFLAFLERDDRLIEPAAGFASRAATLTEAGPAEMINLEVVSPGYFALVGVNPALGRAFTGEELVGDEVSSVVISWELWRSRFAAAPDIVGRTLTLNGVPLVIVGVTPEGFDGLTGAPRLWLPMAAAAHVFSPFMIEEPNAHWFQVLGRLAPGATVEGVRAQMRAIGDALHEVYPPPNASRTFSGSARSFVQARSNENARAAVVLITLAAALLLLVACANLSGLVLTRARRKARDVAVRAAMGASRWRLVRASLVESFVLAGLGGAVGIAVAVAGTSAMSAAWPRRLLRGGEGSLRALDPNAIAVDGPVLVFAVAVSAVAGAFFGVGPALKASRVDLTGQLRQGAGATRRSRMFGGLDVRDLLVAAQVGLALILVVGAGLIGGSTRKLLDVDEGFDTRNLVSFNYTMPITNQHVENTVAFHEGFVERVANLPGVRAATFGCAPMRGHCIISRVDAVRDGPEIPTGQGLPIGVRMVDDQHFDALGIPLLGGRAFDRSDGVDPSPTVILSEMAARQLFGDGDPIGRFIEIGVGSADKDDFSEVVGVVGDVLYGTPDQGLMAEAYYSFRDFPENYGSVTVRAEGDPLAVVPPIRAVLTELDPSIALYRAETMDALIAGSIGDRSATLGLLGLFAAVTLLLAATGTWGVVAYSVADRRRELGLRIALGAGTTRVLKGVLGRGVRTATLGVVAGVLGGLAGSRLLESLLWETDPADPSVYVGASALLFSIVMVSSWIPARRATRVDPVEALRAE